MAPLDKSTIAPLRMNPSDAHLLSAHDINDVL